MATISMCDRCNAIGLAHAIGTLVFHPSPNGKTTKQELCPTCVEELHAWIDQRPDRSGQPAFRQSYEEIVKERERQPKPQTLEEIDAWIPCPACGSESNRAHRQSCKGTLPACQYCGTIDGNPHRTGCTASITKASHRLACQDEDDRPVHPDCINPQAQCWCRY